MSPTCQTCRYYTPHGDALTGLCHHPEHAWQVAGVDRPAMRRPDETCEKHEELPA